MRGCLDSKKRAWKYNLKHMFYKQIRKEEVYNFYAINNNHQIPTKLTKLELHNNYKFRGIHFFSYIHKIVRIIQNRYFV